MHHIYKLKADTFTSIYGLCTFLFTAYNENSKEVWHSWMGAKYQA